MEPRKWNQENGTKKMEAFGSRESKTSFGNLKKNIYMNK
uniref:Uncharacterized protein n=1 Tax=viral metagenome TaxID=1070528 RepID=A0A6C0AFG4_9ZZZZ